MAESALGQLDAARADVGANGFATQAEAGLRGFHHPAPSGLFWLLQPLALAQAHAGAAAVFVDEFDAGQGRIADMQADLDSKAKILALLLQAEGDSKSWDISGPRILLSPRIFRSFRRIAACG